MTKIIQKIFRCNLFAAFPNPQHARSADSVVLERLQRLVRLLEIECLHLCVDGNLRSDAKEIDPVLARVVGDTANAPFPI